MLTIAPDCELEVERGPDWLFVRVQHLAAHDSRRENLGRLLWDLLQQHFTHRLVLEMDETCRLDPVVAKELMWLCDQIEQHDGVMRICGLSTECERQLHASHLDERLLPYHDRMEAVTGCPRPR